MNKAMTIMVIAVNMAQDTSACQRANPPNGR